MRKSITYNDRHGNYRHAMRRYTPRWIHYALASEGSPLRRITLTACGREVDSRAYTTTDEAMVTCPRCVCEMKPNAN
jgi:hypothetical protein